MDPQYLQKENNVLRCAYIEINIGTCEKIISGLISKLKHEHFILKKYNNFSLKEHKINALMQQIHLYTIIILP